MKEYYREHLDIWANLLHHVEEYLKTAPRHQLNNPDWKNKCDFSNGVYVVYENDEMIYVGESSNVKKRVRRLNRSHGLYKKVGPKLFTDSAYTIVFVQLPLGRKEIEEELIRKHSPKYNTSGKKSYRQLYKNKNRKS
ncbi:GIY-YIG nuclease family protein [Bacillus sp. JJ634]